MSRPMVAVSVLALLLSACAKQQDPQSAASERQELPAWAVDTLNVKRQLARDLIKQGNTRVALDVIRDLRTSSSKPDPELDLLQGIALREEGLHSEADRLLSSARSQMPRNAEVHEALCILRADQRMLEEAIDACQRATELDRERASAWNNLGYLKIATGDLAGALKAAERAVDLNPVEARFRNNLALAQAANGRAADALRTFLSTGPRAVAHYNVGAALERFGDHTEALLHYNKALQYDPGMESARDAVARLRAPDHQEE